MRLFTRFLKYIKLRINPRGIHGIFVNPVNEKIWDLCPHFQAVQSSKGFGGARSSRRLWGVPVLPRDDRGTGALWRGPTSPRKDKLAFKGRPSVIFFFHRGFQAPRLGSSGSGREGERLGEGGGTESSP